MKKHDYFYKNIYSYAKWLEKIGYIGMVSLGLIINVEEDSSSIASVPFVRSGIDFINKEAIWFYLFFIVLVLLSFLMKYRGNPWVWEKVQFILDFYQNKVFIDHDDPKDHNRVTLFRYKKNCLFVRHWSSKRSVWPWGSSKPFSSYLIPVKRSGHISQKSTAVFLVSDSSDRSEGVAGHVWSRNKSIVLNDLPDMNQKNPGVTLRRRYAENTYSDEKMVDLYIDQKRPMPRSIAAIPVEVSGALWGVIVLDSRRPDGVNDESVSNFEVTVALIGQLLEKA